MELLLLGTAAAEGWPAPFCDCQYCESARKLGGKNLRSRSGALIDDDLKIDFGADTVLHMQHCGRSLARMRTLVFTHQHSDHIQTSELLWMTKTFTNTPPAQPIDVFGNAQVIAMLEDEMTRSPALKEVHTLHQLEPLRAVSTPGGDEILPLPADHVEGALTLRITRNGKTIFYGHDSGLYPEATLDGLSDGIKLDIVLLDCTFGGQQTPNRGHMDIGGVIQMTEELRRRGAVTENTHVIATHFSHNGGLLHDQLVEKFKPHGIDVAYDGMIVKC